MDEVERIAAALRTLQSGSPEREEYLEKLRSLVQSGEYSVDSMELAKQLLEKATGY